MVFVDGDHNYDVPFLDLQALQTMSHANTMVVMDDLYCEASWCDWPTAAWHKSLQMNTLREFECFLADNMQRGLCVGQYLFGHIHRERADL